MRAVDKKESRREKKKRWREEHGGGRAAGGGRGGGEEMGREVEEVEEEEEEEDGRVACVRRTGRVISRHPLSRCPIPARAPLVSSPFFSDFLCGG